MIMHLEGWTSMRDILHNSVGLHLVRYSWVYWRIILSCIDVPRSNCLPVLSLSVSNVPFGHNHVLMTLCDDDQKYWVSCHWKMWIICWPRRTFSPPRGRFSHLAMFRLGSLLFIPAYLTVVMYRVFASSNEAGNFLLMTGKARFLASMMIFWWCYLQSAGS